MSTTLADAIKQYLSNKDNDIQKSIDKSVNKGKEELDNYKSSLIQEIEKKLAKNKRINSVLLLFISIVILTIGLIMNNYLQSNRIQLLQSEFNSLQSAIDLSNKTFNSYLLNENDSTSEKLKLKLITSKLSEINNFVNPNNQLLLENINFRESYYSNQQVIRNNIEIINDQLNKMHSLYITLLTVFLAFIMLIVAWMLSKLYIKTE